MRYRKEKIKIDVDDIVFENNNPEKEIPISYEGFKNKALTEDFKDIPYYLEESNKMSLFEKKEETENNLETNIYSIEKLLLMDQTNKKLQKKYISIAIDLLNSEKDKAKTYQKEDCLMLEDGRYMVLIDTEELGIGIYMLRLDIQIPDTDFPDGFRKAVVKINPHITVKG
jgi:hypothetical protein